MIQIIAIRLTQNGHAHEHISMLRWRDPSSGRTGENTRAQIVTFLRDGGNAIVSDGVRSINVFVVEGAVPYVRTFADGVWTDNLLALPRF